MKIQKKTISNRIQHLSLKSTANSNGELHEEEREKQNKTKNHPKPHNRYYLSLKVTQGFSFKNWNPS